jgi:hypothetical protein
LDVAGFFALPQGGAECPARFSGVAAVFDCFFDVGVEFFIDFAG